LPERHNVSDAEIFELLSQVYVNADFTSAETAQNIFDPVKVRERGVFLAARETSNNEFSGMVIVVPPESRAIVRAQKDECEMHLLGVKPQFRGHGLGRNLVAKAIEFAEQSNWSKIVLWTQKPMKEAQILYESLGFTRTDEMTKNGIDFLVYERQHT
jgi:ribosomal protein S18 acetylase RimI-like enzyme